jgi:hypothetical protein
VRYFLVSTANVIAQEKISDQSFDERHSSFAVSGVSATLSFGYHYIDTGVEDVFAFRALPDSIDQANGLDFELLRENEFSTGFVEGSVTFQLSETVGFQVDGLYSRQSSNLDRDINFFGVGGHLFRRVSDTGLLGVYGQYLDYDDLAQSYQLGIEAQLYRENLSFEFFTGLDSLEVTTQSTVTSFIDFAQPGIGGFPPMAPPSRVVKTTIDNDFFTAEAIAAFYPTENLRIAAGVAHGFEETSFVTGLEWKPMDKVASNLFIDAQFGENINAFRAGIRFNFSQDNRSLIRQHREGNIQNRLLNNSASLASCVDSFEINGFIDPAIEPIFITPVAPTPAGGSVPTNTGFEPSTLLDGCDLVRN